MTAPVLLDASCLLAWAFTKGQFEELLIDLATRAALDGRTGAIRVVGGSAIALMNTDRWATHDIDAVLAPADQLLDIAHDMARLRGLKPDWLNDAVKGFVPPVGAEDRVEIHRVGDVSASIGSPEMLLAMKLYANRGIRDTEASSICWASARSRRSPRPWRSTSVTTLRTSSPAPRPCASRRARMRGSGALAVQHRD